MTGSAVAPASGALKVNKKAEGRLTFEDIFESARLALLATAGASQAIVEQETLWSPFMPQSTYDLNVIGGSRYWYDLPSQWISTQSYEPMRIQPLDLGGGIVVVGTTTDPPYVTEHLTPTMGRPVNVRPVSAYREARRAAVGAREQALSEIGKRLDAAKAGYAQTSPQDVIRFIDTLGVGQLVTARALGVSPTAVRKWRRGEAARAEHRGRLASFAAMCDLLTEMGLHDPAGWLDIPISGKSTLTPLDLFAAGRSELAVLLGSRLADPQEALDTFDPEWRERYPVDADYEVVTLRDGSRSAMPRRRGRH